MKPKSLIRSILITALVVITGADGFAKPKQEPTELTAEGEEVFAEFEASLESLRAGLKDQIPKIDEARQTEFLSGRKGQKGELESVQPIIKEVDGFLSSNRHDDALVLCAILADAEPRRLAVFIQQGDDRRQLIDSLLGNPSLMKEMLYAGGAKDGRYWHAMEILRDIHEAEGHPPSGPYHRLALAVSLEFAAPELNQLAEIDPVERYRFYARSHRDGELDAHFDQHSIYLLRQVVMDPYSNEDMLWMREMLWNYRPDFINSPENYQSPYVGLMYSEFGHKRPEWDESLPTTRFQQAIDRGGQCGPKAHFGRNLGRAFGLPVWGARLKSHTAMTHWTPNGWNQMLGVSFKNGFWNADKAESMRAWYFHLSVMARRDGDAFMKICRARWAGDALGEDGVDGMEPDTTGGFWNALAYEAMKVVALDQQPEESQNPAPWFDVAYPREADKYPETMVNPAIAEKDRAIEVADNGVISVPAVACVSPSGNTDKVVFMKSRDEGMQLHYKRWGQPEPLVYEITAPADGDYELSAEVVTVNREQFFLVSVNGSKEALRMEIPYTVGKWDASAPITVPIKKGVNKISLNRTVPDDFEKEGYRYAGPEFGGITLKSLTLRPAK